MFGDGSNITEISWVSADIYDLHRYLGKSVTLRFKPYGDIMLIQKVLNVSSNFDFPRKIMNQLKIKIENL